MSTPYLKWGERTIDDFSDANIETLYNQGYLFTRIGRGVMQQTRSVRVDLSKFELSSENRRILRKTESLTCTLYPIPFTLYTWHIGKMAKDFYTEKFGDGTFSANKVKELLTDEEKSNFNALLEYKVNNEHLTMNNTIGYAICKETSKLLHYCYPFYNLKSEIRDLGMGMMLQAILWSKQENKRYIYLGSAQRPTDTYKMQFTGVEWFDGKEWKDDVEELKKIL